jgi:transposase
MERGARLVFESGRPIAHVAADVGVHPETLRKRVRRAEADAGGRRDLLSSGEREELASLRREVKQLRKATEILKAASVFFAGELDPAVPAKPLPASALDLRATYGFNGNRHADRQERCYCSGDEPRSPH